MARQRSNLLRWINSGKKRRMQEMRHFKTIYSIAENFNLFFDNINKHEAE